MEPARSKHWRAGAAREFPGIMDSAGKDCGRAQKIRRSSSVDCGTVCVATRIHGQIRAGCQETYRAAVPSSGRFADDPGSGQAGVEDDPGRVVYARNTWVPRPSIVSIV